MERNVRREVIEAVLRSLYLVFADMVAIATLAVAVLYATSIPVKLLIVIMALWLGFGVTLTLITQDIPEIIYNVKQMRAENLKKGELLCRE